MGELPDLGVEGQVAPVPRPHLVRGRAVGPTPWLHPHTRILDLGAPDAAIARHFAAAGLDRYLALVPPNRLQQVRRSAGDLAPRFVAGTATALSRCNADLLILRGDGARLLWDPAGLERFHFVAVERSRSSASLEAQVAGLAWRLARRVEPMGAHRWGDTQVQLFKLPGQDQPSTRTYFSPAWGPAGLAQRLEHAGLRYAVLRWFDLLPRIEPGEDLDILVHDQDVDAFRALVESEPGTQPIDLYSVSGLPSSDYQDSAYYPPDLARELISRAVRHRSGFMVPSPIDHLNSLAYHAAYHKGPRAGFPSEAAGPGLPDPEHDYVAVIAQLAEAVGLAAPTTFEGLDRYLASVGWRPPADAIRRLSTSNSWAELLVLENGGPGRPRQRLAGAAELSVFLVRERALEVLEREQLLREFDHFGFDVLHDEVLTDDGRALAARKLRGGNWGKGPFPRSGGDPAMLVVALHYSPSPPYPWMRERYPHLTNAETYELKIELRRIVDECVPASKQFNPVHSSDNTAEAWEYLEVTVPHRLAAIQTEALRRSAAYAAPDAVIRTLSQGRRARVDVVATPTGLAVRKTFVPAFLRYFEREVAALRELHGRIAAVPELIETGPNWFTMPYYRDRLSASGGLLPLPLLREMVSVLRELYDEGLDVVDAKPGNFVLDPAHGLKLVDLEFLHRYHGDAPAFGRSMNFVGPGPGFEGDLPVGDMSYESRWLPAAGIPLDVLVGRSVTRMLAYRTATLLRHLTVAPGAPPRRILSRTISVARRTRSRAGRVIARRARQPVGR
ncbi:MAG TPA: hypothetical protein PLB21_09310 [Actinomycetota bacterium]|nr:hypothetical protein [Actinomycetota bacterium]